MLNGIANIPIKNTNCINKKVDVSIPHYIITRTSRAKKGKKINLMELCGRRHNTWTDWSNKTGCEIIKSFCYDSANPLINYI